jgi:hypothetical protein
MTEDVDKAFRVQCQRQVIEASMDSESEKVTCPNGAGQRHSLKLGAVLQPSCDP